MKSCLRILCCNCPKADEKTYFTLTENGSIGKTSYKQRKKQNSKHKGTWTRRSLLANDDYEGGPHDEMAYQMRVINRHQQQLNESPFDLNQPSHQRRKVQDVFAGVQRNTSQTTIPHWMDESFVPNSRTATHLGISSVQINAKRNEIANRRSQDLTTQSYRNNSFSPGVENDKKNKSMNDLLINGNNSNQRNASMPSHNGFPDNTIPRSNVSASRQHVTNYTTSTVPRPVSTSAVVDKTLVLRESQSDVGVRRVVPITPGYRPGNPIPRLEDYTGGIIPLSTVSVDTTDGLSTRSNIETRPQYRQSGYSYYSSDQDSDLSYSSNIIFKKSDVSLKRDNEPAAFSSTAFTNRQQKPKLPLKTRSNPTPKHKPNYAKTAESMYGYVPKIVRNLHASTALEGNQLDDFFMQRMHDRELDKFASIGQDNDEKEEDEAVIVTTVVNKHPSTAHHKVRQTIPEHNILALGNSDELSFNPPTDKHTFSTKVGGTGISGNISSAELRTRSARSESTADQTPLPRSAEGQQPRDGTQKRELESSNTDTEIIMIDFPPNLEKDKPLPVRSPVKLNLSAPVGSGEAQHDKLRASTSGTNSNGTISEPESPIEKEPLSPGRLATDRPRITMGLARTRGAQRTDSDVSRRSTQTTTSSILESAEVLY